jgi:rhodanese-related sulfurtransferase
MTGQPDAKTPPTAAEPAGRPRRAAGPGLAAAIALAALVPPAAYLAVYVRHSVRPPEAKRILAAGRAVLVDTRSPEDFDARHVRDAVNWPHERIEGVTDRQGIPVPLRGRRIVLICHAGLSSADAVRRLRAIGLTDAVHVRGGMQEWIADAANTTGTPWDGYLTTGVPADPPERDMPRWEQWAGAIAGFVVKPLYGLISFVLILVLWRRRDADLAALKWAMICFFLGEQFCAVNYLVFGERSYSMEYLHSLGMLLCFGFTTYALFEAMDRRMIRFSEPDARCAALPLCRRCYKHADVPCGLKRTFLVLIPAMAVLALMPATAGLNLTGYHASVLGSPYYYSHPAAYQMFERIACPAAAIALMASSLAVLLLKRDGVPAAKLLFAAGMGPLGFSLLRLLVSAPYADNQVWFVFWEEATELIFIAGVAAMLWIFRRGLFPKAAATTVSADER